MKDDDETTTPNPLETDYDVSYKRVDGEFEIKVPRPPNSLCRIEMEQAKLEATNVSGFPAKYSGGKILDETGTRMAPSSPEEETQTNRTPTESVISESHPNENPALLSSMEFVEPTELRRSDGRRFPSSSPGAYAVPGANAQSRSESPLTIQVESGEGDEEEGQMNIPEIVAELAPDTGKLVHELVEERLQQERESQVFAHAVVEKGIFGVSKVLCLLLVTVSCLLVVAAVSATSVLLLTRKAPVASHAPTPIYASAPTRFPSLAPSKRPTSSHAPADRQDS